MADSPTPRDGGRLAAELVTVGRAACAHPYVGASRPAERTQEMPVPSSTLAVLEALETIEDAARVGAFTADVAAAIVTVVDALRRAKYGVT